MVFLVGSVGTVTFVDAFVNTCKSPLPQPIALWTAICDLQSQVTALKISLNTEKTARHAGDTNLQNQINSFFDVFVELDDVADKQCPQGQFATGTNLNGTLICTDITQNQDCDDGFYMSGIDDDGKIKCKPLPSISTQICGDGVVTAPETCDDGNTTNEDGCSAICSIELDQICGDGIITSPETCDDGNTTNGDGCSETCSIEDIYELNNSPDTSTDLSQIGSFGTITVNNANIHGSEDIADWYNIMASETDSTCYDDNIFLDEDYEITVTLTNIPLGSDYDLFLYFDSSTPPLLGSSTIASNGNESIIVTVDGDCSPNSDYYPLLIEVRNISTGTLHDPYTLSVTFTPIVGT